LQTQNPGNADSSRKHPRRADQSRPEQKTKNTLKPMQTQNPGNADSSRKHPHTADQSRADQSRKFIKPGHQFKIRARAEQSRADQSRKPKTHFKFMETQNLGRAEQSRPLISSFVFLLCFACPCQSFLLCLALLWCSPIGCFLGFLHD
jgi:hypothetical protein